ncbi:homoserine kinase [Leptolyngbyaceae cyanobacterium CCMR0082]|uniref:Homoserine kinase n=2 Tax=Adonisia turfae TaxID=2950184 RepID=A0A6M0S054_9CYAN|nr:homoserine kinase [Adonisia turfae]NEZ58621.1 homoserine kinase [Adonisia turfae CCMR0081]NEZ61610.1 homoserine kinase [Adonisia turfae CCMR0082]
MPQTAQVTVPATTANIGPGFDCLGAALTLHNHFTFTPADTLTITITGKEADRLSTGPDNLVYKSYEAFYNHLQKSAPPVHIAIDLHVPLSRGLGSSSTAIVGGIVGANLLAGSPLTHSQLASLATELEGHPDNVVPALLGGCQLAVHSENIPLAICQLPWHESIIPIVAIPDFELSTSAARRVLPESYSRADAIFNTAHLGLLTQALATGNGDWLRTALCDRIHQPYRKTLIPNYDDIHQDALNAGAWGLVISGAGPTLLTLASPETAPTIQQTLGKSWQSVNIPYTVHQLAIDHQGTQANLIS